jgi:hypothetical protein
MMNLPSLQTLSKILGDKVHTSKGHCKMGVPEEEEEKFFSISLNSIPDSLFAIISSNEDFF